MRNVFLGVAMRRVGWLWVLVAVVLASGAEAWAAKKPQPPPPPFRYSVRYVNPLPGTASTVASGMNELGDVVGRSDARPFFYDFSTGETVDLNAVLHLDLGFGPDYELDSAVAINNGRQIAGVGRFCRDTEGPTWIIDQFAYRLQAPLASGGTWTLEMSEWRLGTEGASRAVIVGAMNQNGDVLVELDDDFGFYSSVWEAGQERFVFTDLAGVGLGITNRDSTGTVLLLGNEKYRYQTGSNPDQAAHPMLLEVGALAGGRTYPYGMNQAGHVVGESSLGVRKGSTIWHAFLQTGGPETIRDLGLLGGEDSYAAGINLGGDIVGHSNTDQNAGLGLKVWTGFIHTGGKMYDLRTMVDVDASGVQPNLSRGIRQISDSRIILTNPPLNGARACLLLPYSP